MRILSTLILLVGLAACQSPEPSLTDADKAQIEQTITDAMTATSENGGAGDEEGFFRSFHPGAVIASGARRSGLDAYRSWYRDSRKALDRVEFPDRTIEVNIMAPTLAFTTLTSGLFWVDTLGVSSDTSAFVMTAIWSKEDGSWSVIQMHERWSPW